MASSQIPCFNSMVNKTGECRLLTVLQVRLQQVLRASDGLNPPFPQGFCLGNIHLSTQILMSSEGSAQL